MVGPGLKKLALANGMSIASGVAYGAFMGFAVTFSEGSGYKRLAVTTRIHDEQAYDYFAHQLNQHDLRRDFNVSSIQLLSDAIVVVFTDNIGTMSKFTAFCNFFFPLLRYCGADGVNSCNACSTELTGGGCWRLINGIAFHLHEGCAAHIAENISSEMHIVQENDTGTVIGGIFGALLGALIGAIPWAFLLYEGYFASIAGLLIGYGAIKGYELLRGRHSRAKPFIIIAAVIIGVFAGNYAADYYTLYSVINDGLIEGLTTSDVGPALAYMFSPDDDFCRSTIVNLLLGLLFALVGSISLFTELFSKTHRHKIKNLK